MLDLVEAPEEALMTSELEAMLHAAREARTAGHPRDARAGYESAAHLARNEGDVRRLAHALRHVSDLAREARDWGAALTAGEEAVALVRADAQAPPLELANALRVQAFALEGSGQAAGALERWTEARDLYAQLALHEGVAECERHLRPRG